MNKMLKKCLLLLILLHPLPSYSVGFKAEVASVTFNTDSKKVVSTRGIGLHHGISEGFYLEAEHTAGESGNWEISWTGLSLRSYFGESFNVRLGIFAFVSDRIVLSETRFNTDNTVSGTSDIWASTSTIGLVGGLGNTWRWGAFSLGVDWVTMGAPVFVNSHDISVKGGGTFDEETLSRYKDSAPDGNFIKAFGLSCGLEF